MPQITRDQAMQIALAHHQAGRLHEAESIYRQILAAEPKNAQALNLLGVISGQTGRIVPGIQLIRQAIKLAPNQAAYYCNLATLLLSERQYNEAIASCRQALAINPNEAVAHNQFGLALGAKGNLQGAIARFQLAIESKGDYVDAHTNLGNALEQLGQTEQAIACYRRTLELKPDFAEAHYHLGKAMQKSGRLDEAIASYERALKLKPQFVGAHNNLGNTFIENREFDKAIACYQRVVNLSPDLAEAHSSLGNALMEKRDFDEAIACYQRAVSLKPDCVNFHCSLGGAWKARGEVGNAIACYERAVSLKPDFADAHNNLGILFAKDDSEKAINCYRQAIRAQIDCAEAHNNLGNALMDIGHLDEALDSFRRALSFGPNPAFQSNLVYSVHYHPKFDARALLAEARQWGDMYERPLSHRIQPYENDRSPDRRLRIGYVSADFRDHVVGRSMLGIFPHHDRKQFEIIGYCDVRRPDDITRRLEGMVDGWHNIAGISSDALMDRIRSDRIDILADLMLHAAGNRLIAFAQKPAPVQVTLLGPPITTGMSTMDYRLTDPYLDPPGIGDGDYSEQSIRLPNCFWCYPPWMEPAKVNPLPALTAGYVTFACFNKFVKVSGRTIAVWGKVLRMASTSRLLLRCKKGNHRDEVLRKFRNEGVDGDRVEFVGHVGDGEFAGLFHRADIVLDPFPYNGHTSSLDALWMGLPVVTLAGQTAVGRGGVSILSNIGMTDLIADSEDQYASIAAALAGDLPRLAQLRSTLRSRLESSPLMDARQFTADIEVAYRRMWLSWIERST